MDSLILMSALQERITTVTGDISASMTTTNSIMSKDVWQIKDGIYFTKLMDPIASKAINKEAVMFQRMSFLAITIVFIILEVIAWAWRNGILMVKVIMHSLYAQNLKISSGTILVAQDLIKTKKRVLRFNCGNENDLWFPIRNNQ